MELYVKQSQTRKHQNKANAQLVFLYEAFVIPFEISALAIVVQYWSDNVPIWSMVLMCIILYAYALILPSIIDKQC
jgi:L-asparagine transporter-like permease